MPITVLSDVVLSGDAIAAGVRGKNMRMNSRIAFNNGHESINVVWSQTRREFELGFVPMSVSAWQEIETLHEITEGGAYGLLMEDPKDSVVVNGVLEPVDGGGFQLQKRYVHAASGRYKDRPITRPRALGFVLESGGVPVNPSGYTLDVETGRITVSGGGDPAGFTWSGYFYVPVHFMDDSIDWDVVRPGTDDRLLLAGPSVVLQEIKE